MNGTTLLEKLLYSIPYSNIPFYEYNIVIHSVFDGHWCCFQIFIITNKIASNILLMDISTHLCRICTQKWNCWIIGKTRVFSLSRWWQFSSVVAPWWQWRVLVCSITVSPCWWQGHIQRNVVLGNFVIAQAPQKVFTAVSMVWCTTVIVWAALTGSRIGSFTPA